MKDGWRERKYMVKRKMKEGHWREWVGSDGKKCKCWIGIDSGGMIEVRLMQDWKDEWMGDRGKMKGEMGG